MKDHDIGRGVGESLDRIQAAMSVGETVATVLQALPDRLLEISAATTRMWCFGRQSHQQPPHTGDATVASSLRPIAAQCEGNVAESSIHRLLPWSRQRLSRGMMKARLGDQKGAWGYGTQRGARHKARLAAAGRSADRCPLARILMRQPGHHNGHRSRSPPPLRSRRRPARLRPPRRLPLPPRPLPVMKRSSVSRAMPGSSTPALGRPCPLLGPPERASPTPTLRRRPGDHQFHRHPLRLDCQGIAGLRSGQGDGGRGQRSDGGSLQRQDAVEADCLGE